MEFQKFSNWVQMLTGLAMVVGIVLVLFELEQTRDLARAQLASDSANLAMNRHTSFIGEESMSALAKACDAEQRLTLEEALVLDAVFLSMFQTAFRAFEMETIAGFGEDRWVLVADATFPNIFSTQHGRDWWVALFPQNNELIEYGNQILENMGSPSCLLGAEIILATDGRK